MSKSSILRWSGSKAKLIPELKRLRPATFARYIEPFAGSASLFFAVTPRRAILGDLNPHVMAVYRAIGEDPNAVADVLASIPLTGDAYYVLRALDPSTLSLFERAARLIFLMKACFNGVYRTNRQGHFNVPMGNRVYALPTREELVLAQRLIAGTQLLDGDFRETIAHSQPNDWIYMDPPYRQPGRYRGEYGYAAEFSQDALNVLIDRAKELAAAGRLIMLSYAYDERVIAALPRWSVHRVSTVRTVASAAGARREARELILTSYSS